jgi:Uma2 family endonuclease
MSTVVETKAQSTPEDLLAMPDGKSYELVGGQLVERKMGAESSWVGGELHARLRQHCKEHGLGWAFPADNGYQCFPHAPSLVRKADVSLIRNGRLPGGRPPRGWIKIPPDLAVEVVSPHDVVEDLDEKLGDYEKAGVPLVWVIYLGSRTAMVFRSDGSVSRLHEGDELSGEDVILGFRCPGREILLPREPPAEAQPNPAGPNGPA